MQVVKRFLPIAAAMRWPPLRAAAWCGIIGAIVIVLAAPFHAAAYFATPDGSQDLFAHQVAGGEAIRAAVPSAYPVGEEYASYLAFGRVTSSGLALMGIAFLG